MKLLKGKDKSGKPVSGTAKAVVAPAAEKPRLLLIINPVSGKLKARASMFDIIGQLAAAGFEILKKEGECGRRLKENSLRINFIAKRVR